MRKVKYKVYTKFPKEYVFEFGKFHTWGLEMIEFEDGGVNFTVGIIEKENGEMTTSVPKDIVFLNSND